MSAEDLVAKPSENISRGANNLSSRILVVDDQAANVAAARELGIDSFQFLGPEQFVSELRQRKLL